MADVTDASFETEVLDRSEKVPVVVDFWAEWCPPCRALGPLLEAAVAETEGAVELAKIDVDANPAVSSAFGIQSIPMVVAIKDRKVVDQFLGAQPDRVVRTFVSNLVAAPSEVDLLVQSGDEASLGAALELEPSHPGAVVALAEILADRGERDEALALLARIPESSETRRVAAMARLGPEQSILDNEGELESRLERLLADVKDDETARQEFLDLLEALGPEDPRTSAYRRRLTARLF